MQGEYLKTADRYHLDDSVVALEKMFIDAYNEQKEGKDLHSIKPRRKDKRLLKRLYRNAEKQKRHPIK